MKKKTKSKLRNDIALSFLLAIFVSLAGASINSVLFYRSFYQTLTKLNEDPIATITFKYKTAQRKFLDRASGNSVSRKQVTREPKGGFL